MAESLLVFTQILSNGSFSEPLLALTQVAAGTLLNGSFSESLLAVTQVASNGGLSASLLVFTQTIAASMSL